jgi:plasmid stabilization system protein ParE
MTVVVLPEAERQIRAIESWWREHRPAAPGLFAEELANALELISRVPGIGRARHHPGSATSDASSSDPPGITCTTFLADAVPGTSRQQASQDARIARRDSA